MAAVQDSSPNRVDVPGTLEAVDTSTMGGRITWARLRKKVTQKQLAEAIEKSRATIVQYEQNNIETPLSVVSKISNVLGVSPEYLAFGRHGIEGVKNAAEEIVTLPEISFGKDGSYTSSGFAFPVKMLSTFGIDPSGAKVFVLPQEAPAFGYSAGDRLIVDTEIKAVDSSHDLYVLETEAGIEVVRREPSLGRAAGLVFTGRTGTSFTIDPAEITVIGAVAGSVRRA